MKNLLLLASLVLLASCGERTLSSKKTPIAPVENLALEIRNIVISANNETEVEVVNFGAFSSGSNQKTMRVNISNTSGAALQLGDLKTQIEAWDNGTLNPNSVKVTEPTGTSACSNKLLGKNKSCYIDIAVSYNEGLDDNTLTIPLRGSDELVSPTLQFIVDISESYLADQALITSGTALIKNTEVLSFGVLQAGASSVRRLYISNTSTTTALPAPLLPTLPAGVSVVRTTCSGNLAIKSGCLIDFKYEHQASNLDQEISFDSAQMNVNQKTLHLTAVSIQDNVTGPAPKLLISFKDFPITTDAGSVHIRRISLTNLSNISSYIFSANELSSLITDPSFSLLRNNCDGSELAKSKTCYLDLQYQPATNNQFAQAIISLPNANVSTIIKAGQAAPVAVACTPENAGISNALTVAGILPNCVVETCNTNYDKLANTCLAQACALADFPNATAVSGDKVVGCLVTSCDNYFKLNTDNKSCVAKQCGELSPSEVSTLGFNLTGAVMVGVYPSCSITCSLATQRLSGDGKFCEDLPATEINVSITGSGNVTGSVDNSHKFSCYGAVENCINQVEEEKTFKLNAIPNQGNYFVSWEEDCFGESTTLCSLFTSNDKVIRATFSERFNSIGDKRFLGGVTSIISQPDGKYIVAGQFYQYNGVFANGISRINEDGTLDYSFNFPSVWSGSTPYPSKIYLQPDGKILVLIDNSSFDFSGVPRKSVARINADGSFDPSFSLSFDQYGFAKKIAVQSDGKIILVGDFSSIDGVARKNIARVNSDGTIDLSFDPGTGLNQAPVALILQSDGKVLLGGSFSTYNSIAKPYLVRTNSDGSIDESFNAESAGPNGQVLQVAQRPDGKIMISGFFSTYNGVSSGYAFLRLLEDGSRDSTFAVAGDALQSARVIKFQPDGKIVYIGTGNSIPAIGRLNTNGTTDSTFKVGNTNIFQAQSQDPGVSDFIIRPDGKLIVVGTFSTFTSLNTLAVRNNITSLDPNGNHDTLIQTKVGLDAAVNKIVIQSDGKAIVVGAFTSYKGVAQNRIIRFNTNGSKDNTFNIGTGANNEIHSVLIQSDNKIVISGKFTSYNGTSIGRLARLNADGTLDTTFAVTNIGLNGYANSVAQQADGKLILGGTFLTYNGYSVKYLTRLNTDGTIDQLFPYSAGFNNIVNKVLLQADGSLLVGGNFTAYGATTVNYLAKLTNSGTLDPSFIPGTGPNKQVLDLAIYPGSKILVAGDFESYNGTSKERILRINSNGTNDTSFLAQGPGVRNSIKTLAVQLDGKILFGGQFNLYPDISRDNLGRLNADGTADITFIPASVAISFKAPGTNKLVYTIAVKNDGTVFIGGLFTVYNYNYTDYFLKLNSNGIESVN